jgi:hypothetical protein
MKRTGCPNAMKEYKVLRKKIRKNVMSLRKSEINKLLKNRSMKNVWKGVNHLRGNSPANNNEAFTLKVGEDTVTDQSKCAETFNNAFSNKVNNHRSNVTNTDLTGNMATKKVINNDDSPVSFTLEEIATVIKSMKKSKSTGPDDIPITFVKDIMSSIINQIKFIFDKVGFLALMPLQWKVAKLIPLYKKGERSCPSNYRPISNICCLGKVFEKCLLNQLNGKFGSKIHSTFQHGFRSHHSTTTAALTIQKYTASNYCRYRHSVLA